MSELDRLQNRIETKLNRLNLQDLQTVNLNLEAMRVMLKSVATAFYDTLQKVETDFHKLEDRVKALEDKVASS
jgi:hypothetical protein